MFYKMHDCRDGCQIGQYCDRGTCRPPRREEDWSTLQHDFMKHMKFGVICLTDDDCGDNAVCIGRKCVVKNGFSGKFSFGTQCPNGYNFVDGKCEQSRHFAPSPMTCPKGTVWVGGVCKPYNRHSFFSEY